MNIESIMDKLAEYCAGDIRRDCQECPIKKLCDEIDRQYQEHKEDKKQ